MMLENARFWSAIAHCNPERDRYEIDGLRASASVRSYNPIARKFPDFTFRRLRDDWSMLKREDTVRPHDDDEMRARFAIRKGLSAMEAEEREMERAMKAFEEDADQAKRYIEAEWRREHWGHKPEHPPSWKVR